MACDSRTVRKGQPLTLTLVAVEYDPVARTDGPRDLSGVSGLKIRLLKPNRADLLTYDATAGGDDDNEAAAEIEAGDLDQVGPWQAEIYEGDTGMASTRFRFQVEPTLADVAEDA